MTEPLVSCLMVTRNRAGLARRAIDCFAAQTWSNKELVIVDDGHEDYTPVIASYPSGTRITYHRLPPDPERTLGAARNASLELASGDYLAQWDDDEWYHPDRLRVQMAAISSGLGAVVLKETLMHLDAPDFVRHPYRADLPNGTPGTVVHQRSDVRYPELRRDEDGIYLDRLREVMKVGVPKVPHSHLFIRCFHGDNTWGREHFLRRLNRKYIDKISYQWATRVRGDLFKHRAFQLNDAERESANRFLDDSKRLGLMRNA